MIEIHHKMCPQKTYVKSCVKKVVSQIYPWIDLHMKIFYSLGKNKLKSKDK